MKKKEPIRLYHFPDATLVTKGKEKTAFMLRDAAEFLREGISEAMITDLEAEIDSFAEEITDVEAGSDQKGETEKKDIKAEELRVAIRAVMSKAERKFGIASAKYKKFGTDDLANQTDPNLVITGKRVARVGSQYLPELVVNGLTDDMLSNIDKQSDKLVELIVNAKVSAGDRDVMQEDRVETANAIYATLISYTKTGQDIWETGNVAKYNDYIMYNTVSGEAEKETPAP